MRGPSDEIINILNKYCCVIKAQSILEKCCENIGTSMRELSYNFVPEIILQITKLRNEFSSIDNRKFNRLLRDLTLLSNSNNPRLSQNIIEQYVNSERKNNRLVDEI